MPIPGVRRRWYVLVAVALAAAVAVTAIALTRDNAPVATPGIAGPTSAPASPPVPSPSGAVLDSLRVDPTAGGTLLVHGVHPKVPSRCVHPARPTLDARYPGSLTVQRASDGTLSLTVQLPFERYLDGIAEVPASWPMAALRAQAVAARSYALAQVGWTGAPGETLSTPICSTTACQVYAGLPTTPSGAAARWYEAVRTTAGQILVYRGRPADTFYFSTSNGQTYGNDQVFGGAPLPYLRPVVERDDGASPVSRWRVRFPFADLARFLAAAGDWPGGDTLSSVARGGDVLALSGDGASRTLDVSTFERDVDVWAPCLEPNRYPGLGSTGSRLPSAVPSRWFGLRTSGGAAILTGRGWGHGVGMVQWGAYGKARRGLPYGQILAYYYGGLVPVTFPEPGQIRVQVAEGLSSVTVRSSTEMIIRGNPVGPGPVRIIGGQHLTVTPIP